MSQFWAFVGGLLLGGSFGVVIMSVLAMSRCSGCQAGEGR